MINKEKYIQFLKQIIACINYGDYYSVKELSQLELEKIQEEIEEEIQEEKNNKINIKNL